MDPWQEAEAALVEGEHAEAVAGQAPAKEAPAEAEVEAAAEAEAAGLVAEVLALKEAEDAAAVAEGGPLAASIPQAPWDLMDDWTAEELEDLAAAAQEACDSDSDSDSLEDPSAEEPCQSESPTTDSASQEPTNSAPHSGDTLSDSPTIESAGVGPPADELHAAQSAATIGVEDKEAAKECLTDFCWLR